MFEVLIERAARIADKAAARRRAALAQRAALEAPPGVRAEESEKGIVLAGRNLRQRSVTEAAVRALIGGMR